MSIRDVVLTRRSLLLILLAVAVAVFVVEMLALSPRVLEWHPWDYGNYVEMGRAVREGQNPYGADRYYPLPTILWVFVPLSLMPDWFKIIWALFPFVFLLLLFGYRGVFPFFYPPFWFVVTDAMLDGWLLFPIAWLFANRSILAGVGAAFLLFKPHVTVFVVAYMTLRWIITHDWKNLGAFFAMLCALWLPSFIVNPLWLLQMLGAVQGLGTRANYAALLPMLTSSIWGWWWRGGLAQVGCLALLCIAIMLFWRAFRYDPNRAPAIQLTALLLNPMMLAANLITVLPTLRTRNQIIAVTVVSLGAYMLDALIGPFGGGYALIPLAALYFQTHDQFTNPLANQP
jgi:hypothetical protein